MIRDTSVQDKLINPQAKRHLARWLILSLAIICVAAYLVFNRWSATFSVSHHKLRTAVVFKDTFVRDINATGRVVATNAPTLYSSAIGTIKFLKQPGEAVKKKDIVAKVNSPELVSQFEQEKANLQSAQIELERMRLQGEKAQLELKKAVDIAQVKHTAAQRELDRARASHAVQVISTFDYQKAHDDLSTAILELNNARQANIINSNMIEFEYQTTEVTVARQRLIVDEFQRRIDQLTLRAPVDGMMGNWLVDQDSNVSTSQALLVVVDLSAYEGELDIPETFADELSSGMQVEIRIGEAIINGQLGTVSPEVTANSVKARVTFIGGEALNIRQNQRIAAKILLEARPDVIQVAKGPYLHAGDFAYVIKEGVAQRQPIEIGSRSLDKIEILSGLSVGEEIVISSVETFKEHQAIYIN